MCNIWIDYLKYGEDVRMAEITRRERKKEATKTTILKVAIDLINERGFADTTMQLIAEKADVALRTLYNYFPSKESIVATYMRLTVQQEAEKGWPDLLKLDSTCERLMLMCQITAAWAKENPVLIKVYTLDPLNYLYGPATEQVPRSGLEEIVTSIMEMGQQMGDVVKRVPAQVLTRQFLGFYHFSVLTWLSDPEQDLLRIFQEGLDILFRGIRADGINAESILRGMFG